MTRASRNLVNHHRHVLEKHFGHGLVGLYHPVTGEFNHEAVIKRRGGIGEDEWFGTLDDYYVPHILGAIHKAHRWLRQSFGDELPENNMDFFDRAGDPQAFNRYDTTSMFYGWAGALVEDDDDKVSSDCFISLYELITQIDILRRDFSRITQSWRLFDATIFEPTLTFNNAAATYE